MKLARLTGGLLSRKGEALPVAGIYDGTTLAPFPAAPGPGRFGRQELPLAPASRPAAAMPRHELACGRNQPVHLTLRLDPARHRRLKIVAARTGRSSCDLIREALDRYLPDACPDCACLQGELGDAGR